MKLHSVDKNITSLLKLKYGIVGNSGKMHEAVQLLLQAAPTDLAVLITGETGTGKEVFANALHGLSNRKKYQFVSVNCAAIPETLLESELFGHERGAFTGATDQRKGFFEVADNGTIFLDEIGDMPFTTQVKLLRVLESGEFSRLGSSDIRRVNVRLVAATNKKLEDEVRKGNFRQDLFFRLNSVHIYLPALREHTEDLPALVEYFASRVCEKLSKQFEGISGDAVNILKSLNWAGNVRELRNLIETVITLEEITYITPENLRQYIARALPPYDNAEVSQNYSLIPFAEDEPKKFELELIFRTLLELKSDMNDLKRGMQSLSVQIDFIKDAIHEIQDNVTIQRVEENEVPTPEEKNTFAIEEMEKDLILKALQEFRGNRRQTAKALGISERTLYRKLNELRIEYF